MTQETGIRELREVQCGKVKRKSFGKIKEAIEIPYLIKIQRDSYARFIKEGIREVFEDFSPITDYSDHFELYFLDHTFEGPAKHSEKECKNRDATYALPLRVKVRLINKVTNNITDQEVYMGDIPMMTDNGSFIINGAERVVVSQLVRSPGVYCYQRIDKSGKKLFDTTIMPSRGAWLEFEQDANNILSVKVDRTRKIAATALLRSFGFATNEQIKALFNNDPSNSNEAESISPIILETLEKDNAKNEKDGLIEIFRRLRQGEIPTDEAIRQLHHNVFFDVRRYDLAKVGRYKYNKRLRIGARIAGLTVADDVVTSDGEVIITKGEVISREVAENIQNAGINEVYVMLNGKKHKIIGNNVINFKAYTGVDAKDFDLLDTVYYPVLKFAEEINDRLKKGEDVEKVANDLKQQINAFFYLEDRTEKIALEEKNEDRKYEERANKTRINFVEACQKFFELLDAKAPFTLDAELKKVLIPLLDKLNHKHITADDVVASISLNLDLVEGLGSTDVIDHLGNRRIRSVGELLQGQFRIGMLRLEKVIKERMGTQDPQTITPQGLINVRPVNSAIKEFFGSSQLSQFMDQTNPIAELTHKRKLSALGPGGLNRDRATNEVRDVNHSHYGRICPIETPEGQNIGLISSLSTFARVNELGFIESPYRRVDKKTGVVTDIVDYLTADEEDNFTVAQANEPLDETSHFVNERISCRRRDQITEDVLENIDYMDVSPKQLISVATALIPFLENDDTNRALMGSNMQRQAVPLLQPDNAVVATGIEHIIARDSGVMVISKDEGVVKSVASDEIVITDINGEDKVYELKKFERSNQCTCLNQKPIVDAGDKVKVGDILADGPSTKNGELALGRNILIGFMSWEGYNYEDAILLSEKLVREDTFTSIHIVEHETVARETRLGDEEITRDIANLGEDVLKDLDENGIIRIGAEVGSGDILVGKVTPKGETELTPEERLLRAIFGEKSKEVKDTSLRVPHGEGGIVVDVKVFDRSNKQDELPPGVNKQVKVYIAQKRKISVGDKMAGRHGNKGVVSRILSEADMPFMADGTPLEIVLNPLGVPSRMNIGQVLEVHLGLVCKQLGWKIATPVFDGATEEDIKKLFASNNIVNPDGQVDGKIQLYDGRTGQPFDNRVTVGQMYMIKLIHLVDDKIHARSIGPYSLITQQPLGGKAQFGGQRFGEMEVWALEAYGAAHILQEILTVKSDDILGRTKTYESIVKGNSISEPGIPESFKVLLKELQSLALDMKVLTDKGDPISLDNLTDSEYDDKQPIREKEETKEDVDILGNANVAKEDNDDESEYSSSDLFENEEYELDSTVPSDDDLSGFDIDGDDE